MSEEKKPSIQSVLSPVVMQQVGKDILRSRKSEKGVITYDSIKKISEGKEYTIYPVHFPMEKVFEYGKSSCKDCNGKGYLIKRIEKKKFPDPSTYLLMEDLPPMDLSEAQMKIWEEKKKEEKMWRIMEPCHCAVKRAFKENENLLANGIHTMFLKVDYDVADAPKEIADSPKEVKEEEHDTAKEVESDG